MQELTQVIAMQERIIMDCLAFNPKLTGERMNEVNEASPANKVSDVERVVI
jgi:hypothetical protein